MSDMIGLSVADMDVLIQLFKTKAGELDALINEVDGKVQSTQWVGQDASRFKGEEWGQAKTQLGAVKTLFDTTAGNLTTQKTAQEGVSGQ